MEYFENLKIGIDKFFDDGSESLRITSRKVKMPEELLSKS